MRRKRAATTFVLGSQRLSRIGLVQFDWRDPYYTALNLGWTQFSALMLAALTIINMVFAGLYAAVPGCIVNIRPYNFADAFFFSVETIATVGYGVMAPATTYGHVVATIEIVTGMAFTAISTGLLFVRFAKPKPRIMYADHAVVAQHNGKPTLMIRIANGRASLITHARAELYVLLAHNTTEGKIYYRMYDLVLQRSRLPIFAMSWTLMHTLDEQSPLFHCTEKFLSERKGRIFLTLEARDHMFGTSIQDVCEYGLERIKFGMRFVDAVTVTADGEAVADLRKLSMIETDDGLPPEPTFASGEAEDEI